jgi:hypothetical protein
MTITFSATDPGYFPPRFASEDEYHDAKAAAAWEAFCELKGIDQKYTVEEIIDPAWGVYAKQIQREWDEFRRDFEW